MADKQVVLITGGNTGLGLETVRALRNSLHAYHIIIGSRSLDKANEAIKTLESESSNGGSTDLSAVQVDIESDDSIARAFETISSKFDKVDILINNAGGSFDGDFKEGRLSMREVWNKTWNTNVAGTQIITHTFVHMLLKSGAPRILFITSGLSTLEGTTKSGVLPANKSPPKGWPKSEPSSSYRSAKTGMNMMAREWVRVLKDDGVKVFIISPGLLATGLGGNPEFLKKIGAQPPSVGAEVVRGVAEGERDADAGLVIFRNATQPW